MTTVRSQTLLPGRYARQFENALGTLRSKDFLRRFLAKDAALWKPEEAHARIIRNRMGWLDSARHTLSRAGELQSFAEGLRQDGFTHVVLLGMGGSSLCPDVLRRTFRRIPDFPGMLVLDSTDPAMVAGIERAVAGKRPLFIVASKSGTTVESQMFYQYFAQRAGNEQFAAITDAATPLERLGQDRAFRRVFINPPDIGGRYSALSLFGMVPAACAGIDVAKILASGDEMIRCLRQSVDPAECPPVALGALLGALGAAGRDKVTFFASPAIASFGYWVEQLVAESTGKEEQGLVPVEGEPIAAPAKYGQDRLFVHLKLKGSRDTAVERKLAALTRAGHPAVTIELPDRFALGAEFNRWEIATAVAASILGIDPFDEPNVSESKQNTAAVLQQYRATGAIPSNAPDFDQEGVQGWAIGKLRPSRTARRAGRRTAPPLQQALDALARSSRAGDYIAILAYLPMTPPIDARLARLRVKLRDRCRTAVTVGYGPRFLHSTGQLHKGGPGTGIFLQITAETRADLPIPGEPFTFGVLQAAQAAGDLQSLARRGYRVLRLHLRGSPLRSLDRVIAALPSR